MTKEEFITAYNIGHRDGKNDEYLPCDYPEFIEQEPCDEHGNYKYPSDVELTIPNTATSMPCGDAVSRQAVWDVMQELWGTSGELLDRLMALPPVNPISNVSIQITEREKYGRFN